MVEAARELGIPYLTLFAFSSENWGRPATEVRFLMRLFHRYLVTEGKRLMKRGIRVIALGDIARLPLAGASCAAADRRDDGEESHHDGRRSRSPTAGRQDIVTATRRIAQAVAEGRLDPADHRRADRRA